MKNEGRVKEAFNVEVRRRLERDLMGCVRELWWLLRDIFPPIFVLFLSHPDIYTKALEGSDGVFHSKSNEWTKIRAIDSGLVF